MDEILRQDSCGCVVKDGAEELYRVSDTDEQTNLASYPESQDIPNQLRTRLGGILTSDTGRRHP